jgi:hypothetical protein
MSSLVMSNHFNLEATLSFKLLQRIDILRPKFVVISRTKFRRFAIFA